MEITRPALVLGSSQDRAVVDAAACGARGIEIVRRRSGGGMVLLEPRAQAWVDVLIPTGHLYWDDDVSRAFDWLASAWQRALLSLGVGTDVANSALETGEWGRLVCFAGRGPGELLLDDAKVVGMSLRRTRTGARFQTTALCTWHPESLVELVAPSAADPKVLLTGLEATGRGLGLAPGVLSDALVAELSRLP
jgi:lipoate-protein ligase A